MPLSLGVLISGSGTNLGAIFEAIERRELDAKVELVLSNRPDAAGLDRARQRQVPCAVVSHRDFASRELFDAELVRRLQQAGVDTIMLAGFMRVVTPVLLQAFPDRVLNVHPALLPAFPGVDAQAQALAYGAKMTGCTVHFVDQGVDTGPIIAQASVPILEGDDAKSLAARILVEEHRLVVTALSWLQAGRLLLLPTDDGRERRVCQVRES